MAAFVLAPIALIGGVVGGVLGAFADNAIAGFIGGTIGAQLGLLALWWIFDRKEGYGTGEWQPRE